MHASLSGPPPDVQRLEGEASEILRSLPFERSPVLSRLLAYLVKMSVEGKFVKAFDVAVDGLGRAEHESIESDTYARVAVARLRRALANYYAANPQDHEIHIDPGSYVVRLRPREPEPQPATEPAMAAPATVATRRWNPTSGVLVVVVVTSLLLTWFLSSRSDERVWAKPNFPNVLIARAATPTPQADECRSVLITALNGYAGIRLVDAGTPADYEIRLTPSAINGEQRQLASLIHSPSRRFLWSHSAPSVNDCLDESEMVRTSLALAGPGGVIESFARRRGVDPHTPYGCWLQFTQSIKVYNTVGNDALEDCSERWYAVSSVHPVAAFLYSWTLIDKAATEPVSISRKAGLKKAQKIATDASLLNSEFASLYIARMRAESFLGDREGTLFAARQAIDKSQNNPAIVGMAASGMAMWGDPEGERTLLSMSAASYDRQMPWENAGLFVAAMLRDDTEAAGRQIAQLADYDNGQPVLRIFKAAYLARTGKRRQADAVLDSLSSDPRIWIAGTDRLIARLPMAPEAKKQLAKWLDA